MAAVPSTSINREDHDRNARSSTIKRSMSANYISPHRRNALTAPGTPTPLPCVHANYANSF